MLIALSDRPECVEAFWGAIKIGAVAVPVDDGLGAEEYAFLLADSRARVVVADRPRRRRSCPRARNVRSSSP